MEPRDVVENALRSLVAQDAALFMRWFHEDVVYEAPPQPRITGRFRYFQEIAAVLTPGTGARASGFNISRVDPGGQPVRWIQTSLRFEVPNDGSMFPTEETKYATQESEVWFGVQGDKIVEVKAFSKPHSWHFSA